MRATLTRAAMLGLLAAAPSAAAAQSAATVRVGIESGAETFAEPRYGVQAGIFARGGLDVQLTTFPTAGPIIPALAGGSLDIGMGDVILLANAVNRGLPIVAIAASGLFRTTDPTSGLCVLRSSSIKSPKDFVGQTLAVGTLVSLTSISLRMWLSQGGVNPDQVQFIEMKFPEMVPALERGTIATAYVPEPLITLDADKIKMIATPYSAIAPVFPISVAITSKAWLAQNPEAARKFVTALYDTARWANANRAQTASVLADYTKIDLSVIQRMHRASFATELDVVGIQAVLDAAATNKLIDRPTNAADLIAHLG